MASSFNACGRCLLRTSPTCTYAYYRATPDPQSSPTCPVCLGVLHHESYLDRVVAAVQGSNYEFSSYKLQVALPPSLMLRQVWLQHKLGADTGVDVKDVLKWGFSADLAKRLGKPFSPDSRFIVKLTFECDEADRDLHLLRRLVPGLLMHEGKTKRPVIDEFSTKALLQGIGKLSPGDWDGVLSTYTPQSFPAKLQVELTHLPIFVAGSYLKYSRKLSQSPWLIEGEDQPTGSIQELIGEPLKEAFRCATYSLHGSVRVTQGREDVDVRMLGSGRPFVLSLMEPKASLSAPATTELEATINRSTSLVQVTQLRLETEKYFEQLKAGEEDKLKAYCAVVWTDKVLTAGDIALLNSMKNVVLQQKTPVRVLHRRSLLTRTRNILEMRGEIVSEHLCILKMISSAGTYIKEFVHGDLGRTTPHVGQILGCKADIVQLDVLGLAWKVEELTPLLS